MGCGSSRGLVAPAPAQPSSTPQGAPGPPASTQAANLPDKAAGVKVQGADARQAGSGPALGTIPTARDTVQHHPASPGRNALLAPLPGSSSPAVPPVAGELQPLTSSPMRSPSPSLSPTPSHQSSTSTGPRLSAPITAGGLSLHAARLVGQSSLTPGPTLHPGGHASLQALGPHAHPGRLPALPAAALNHASSCPTSPPSPAKQPEKASPASPAVAALALARCSATSVDEPSLATPPQPLPLPSRTHASTPQPATSAATRATTSISAPCAATAAATVQQHQRGGSNSSSLRSTPTGGGRVPRAPSHVRFAPGARDPADVPACGSFGFVVDSDDDDALQQLQQDVEVSHDTGDDSGCDVASSNGSDDARPAGAAGVSMTSAVSPFRFSQQASSKSASRQASGSGTNRGMKPPLQRQPSSGCDSGVERGSGTSRVGPPAASSGSVTGMRIAGVTGADLVTRALQRGMGSMRRTTSSDGAPGAGGTTGSSLRLAKPSLRPRPVSAAAVSLAFLLDFSAHCDPGLSTLDVVYKIIVPQTDKYRCRYADYIPDEHLGIPDYFVSHRWASPFQSLVSSLFLHFDCSRTLTSGTLDPNKIFLWLDIFAVNQHPGEAQVCDLAGLQAALGAARQGTLLVLDEAGLVLTRIWCLYEIHHTIRLKSTQGLRVLAAEVQFAELRDIFNSLDAGRAQATVEADRQRILHDIQATTGIDTLNRGIKEALVGSCVLEAQASLARRVSDPPAFVAAHTKAGQMLRVAGRYADAGAALKQAMEVYEGGGCARDKQCAVVLISLGTLQQEEGKLADAERFCRAGLQLSEELLAETVARYRQGGQELPGSDVTVADVMTAISALASVLQAEGKFNEALPYFEKALDTCKKVRGEAHPDTGTAMTSLAGLLQALGRTHDALKLLRKVQALREKHLGEHHPLTACVYEALGGVLQQRGALEEAEPLFTKALDVRRHALGPQHPAVGSSLHALAALRAEQGRYEEAEQLYVAALDLRQAALGPGHPAYAATLNNLAALYQETGRYDEAVPLMQRALEARTRALGPEHPATSATLNNLATLLLERGHVEAALPLYLEHVRVLEKVLGSDHADVALGLENYATCLKAAGQLDKAASVLRRALAVLEQALGSSHSDVAACAANLAGLLQEQGALREAARLYERALAIRKEVHGEQHSTQVVLLHALGVIAAKEGGLALAAERLRAAVAMRRALTADTASAESSRPVTPLLSPMMSTVLGSLASATGPSMSLATRPSLSAPSLPGGLSLAFDLAAGSAGPGPPAGGRSKSVLTSRHSMHSTRSGAARRVEWDLQLALSLNELGNVLQDMGLYQEAHDAYQEALELRDELLGGEAEETAIARENLACVLLELGQPGEAVPLLRHSLQVNLALPGAAAQAAAALSSYNLGRALEAQGSSEARDAYERAVRLAEGALGPDHPDTQQYANNLESFLSAGQAAAAKATKPKSARRRGNKG